MSVDPLQCATAWDCEFLSSEAVLDSTDGSGSCLALWHCGVHEYGVNCEPVDSQEVRCTCSKDGKEGKEFVWPGPVCENDAVTRDFLNQTCDWALPLDD